MVIQVTNIGGKFIVEDGTYINAVDKKELVNLIGQLMTNDFVDDNVAQLVITAKLEVRDSVNADPIIPLPNEDYGIK